MKIFIVVTCYNEEKNILTTIEDLLNFGYQNIVVVDDFSGDKTVEIVESLPVKLLKHRVNRGQGASLQSGHDFAYQNGADVVVDFDGDGQMQAKDIEKLIQPIVSGKADIVFGTRALDKNSQVPWLKKNFIHLPGKLLNNFLSGIKLSDTHCGFRALGREAMKKLVITQDRMAHASEIVFLTKKLNLKYCEVPVEIIYKEFGQGFLGGVKILRELFIDKLLK